MAGLGGSLRLGNEALPVGGADIGAEVGNGLGGTIGAVPGGDGLLLLAVEGGDDSSTLGKRATCSVSRLLFKESGLEVPDVGDGEFSAMAFDKKSVYADGGLMGVLTKSGSSLLWSVAAERGVAEQAEVISDGNVAVSGVESFSNLGFMPGIFEICWGRGRRVSSRGWG